MKINSNTVLIVIVCIAIAGMLAVLGYTYLEPYKKTFRGKATEAEKENGYLALDRWLAATGHKVRLERSGNAKSVQEAPEDVILIYTSAFDFEDSKTLIDAIKAGKKVTIITDKVLKDTCYDFFAAIRVELKKQYKLDETSIEREYFSKKLDPHTQSQYETLNRNDERIKKDADIVEIKKDSDKVKVNPDDDDDYNRYETDYYYFQYIGKGFLNTSSAYTTQNTGIASKYYAQDIWGYTGNIDTEDKGIYIIRSKETENGTLWLKKTEITLWNLLTQKGALLPIVIPAIAIIIFGFWIILLPFGKNIKEHEIHGKPIRMRFLAEAHFYKKHNLLNKYLKYLPKDSTVSDNENVTVSDLKKLLDKRNVKE